ncbi:hypothetical protein TSAR_004796 [Trichomalopsis sarcophagae]|uniref:Uncharacterized protein n=1 Tax=Trichomalopsis sarcophagae TaxID=543379 RepID=A0A232EJD5_9HYME|nr:hypothetical protein TSAR_004796 [Trichomalopsis sarcophagae]
MNNEADLKAISKKSGYLTNKDKIEPKGICDILNKAPDILNNQQENAEIRDSNFEYLKFTSLQWDILTTKEKERLALSDYLQDIETVRAITEAYEANCKLVRGKGKYQEPWWNNRLEKLKKTTKALLKKAVKSNDNQKWIAWRSKQKEYRHAVRIAQTESWREYCSSVESGKEAARLNNILARNPEAWLGAVKLPTGNYTESDEETLAHLMESNFPGFMIAGDICEAADDQVETGGKGPRHISGCRELANLIVSPAKLRWAISSLDSYKSLREDGILPILLKEGVDTIIGRLVRLTRASIAAGYTPKCWRTAKVVFIPKMGKGSYNTAKDFRPICLTSFMLKTLERLMDRYIKDYILKDNPLCNEQHSYREGRSTESALHGAVSLIEEQIEGPRHISGCRELANLIVSPAKLRWAISYFDCYKSPGEDGILPILLKEGVDTIIGPLVRLTRASIAAGYTPKCWRTVKVVFIPKAGKGSYNTAKDFRPICLTSVMLKTLEYIKDNPLCIEQHAYREGRSTESALHGAVSLIEEQIEGGGYTVGAFFDAERAFNNTTTNSICKAAKEKGIPDPLIKWIMNMLSNRKLTVTRGSIHRQRLRQQRMSTRAGSIPYFMGYGDRWSIEDADQPGSSSGRLRR